MGSSLTSTCRVVVVPIMTLALHGRPIAHANDSSVGVTPHASAMSTISRVAAIAALLPYLGWKSAMTRWRHFSSGRSVASLAAYSGLVFSKYFPVSVPPASAP
jgi:hypothetical protein